MTSQDFKVGDEVVVTTVNPNSGKTFGDIGDLLVIVDGRMMGRQITARHINPSKDRRAGGYFWIDPKCITFAGTQYDPKQQPFDDDDI